MDISMSSHNIKDIIGNIEKRIEDHISVNQRITSQIKLLSLNATIEEARAGNAGREFAVVACEVKTLAGQASSTSKEMVTIWTGTRALQRRQCGRKSHRQLYDTKRLV